MHTSVKDADPVNSYYWLYNTWNGNFFIYPGHRSWSTSAT